MADILGMDRATVYHAIKRAKELLSIKDGHYVLSVQRWASIIDEFEEDMVKVDSMKRTETTEQIILEVLSKYDEAKALDILRSVTQKIQSWQTSRENQQRYSKACWCTSPTPYKR